MARKRTITIYDDDCCGRRGGGRAGTGNDPGEFVVLPPPKDPGEFVVLPPPKDPGEFDVLPPPKDPGEFDVLPPPKDPGEFDVLPPPKDPGEFDVLPPPIDPGEFVVLPPPKDPRGSSFGASGGGCDSRGGCGSCGGCGCCCQGDDRPAGFGAHSSGFVVVRLTAEYAGERFASLWDLARALGLDALREVLELAFVEDSDFADLEGRADGAQAIRSGALLPTGFRPPPPRPEEDCGDGEPPGTETATEPPEGHWFDRILELEARAARSPFRPLRSLTQYWQLDVREHAELVDELVERLNELAVVEIAYLALRVTDSAHRAAQGYRDDAPVAVGGEWALRHWQALANGASAADRAAARIRCVDLEQGWILDHEALGGNLPNAPIAGDNRDDDEAGAGNHGTAVLAQMAGETGVLGLARGGVATFDVTSHYRGGKHDPASWPPPRTNGHVALAIVAALADPNTPLGAGDVLLLEVQRGGLPTEVDDTDFDAIRLASALGVLVVEAAGNGGIDLDRVATYGGRTFRRGHGAFVDSGALMVGAAESRGAHARAAFSTFGSRVDCFAWGDGVTTAGYGNLSGTGPRDSYTATFGGTSAASPIVAGAALLLQSIHRLATGVRLMPAALRAVLGDPSTGTRQGRPFRGHIGVMPDLRRIVQRRLSLVADPYLRSAVCDHDDGASAGIAGCCPDVFLASSLPPGSRAILGAGGVQSGDPAPGEPLHLAAQAADPPNAFVRLRNRGLVDAEPKVRVYAGPVATFVPPEGWVEIGELVGMSVPAGDLLTLSTPIAVDTARLAASPGDQRSLLAVLRTDGDPASGIVPPGPPYFDWLEYLRFLARRDVGWRNVHRVKAQGGGAKLRFDLVGAPDEARDFDLEVVQSLPPGTQVTLDAGDPGLQAILRQRRPEPISPSGAVASGPIDLPRRRSTRFSAVRIPTRTSAQATLEVKGSPSAGHSLAIRQLWRGLEIGRVTWLFG